MILSPDPSFCGIMELIRMLNDLFRSTRKDAVDVEVDRLSNLPDELIHKILSFINIKDAISTSVLSSRWRFIWTSMPDLNFENLNNEGHFSNFVSNVLSHRNNQVHSSVNLVLGRTVRDDESVTTILSCAFSHNLQQLSVSRSRGDLVGCPYSFIGTPTWDLPALTTLHLHHVKLSDYNDIGLFSKCTNLKNLSLKRCRMKETKVLNICHPRLSNLTLLWTPPDMELEVNVVAPQLNNLTIRWCKGKHLISAPELTSLVIEGFQPWQVSTPSGFHSLEKVELFMYDPYKADTHRIVCLLLQLHSVKLLTLNLGILKRLFSQRKSLSSSMKLIPHKACAFANTKILKFTTKPVVKVYLEVQAQERVTTYTEIKNDDDTSPSAIFPMVSCEEITVMDDMQSAQVFVNNLGILLEECKEIRNSEADKAHMDEHGKPHVEMHWAWELQRNLGAMMALFRHEKIIAEVKTCFMMLRIKQNYINMNGSTKSKNHPIIAWLYEMCALFKRIEQLITQLSASKRAVMLPIFLSLCEDATILTINMLGWLKTIK